MKLDDSGDPFEKQYALWIRTHLHGGQRALGYEKVWQEFIGNNGRGVPLAILGLDEETESLRQTFFEAHYSMVIAAFLFDRIAKQMTAIGGMRTTVEGYLQDVENYAIFINYLGNVCDMVGHMDKALKAKDEIHDHVFSLHKLRSNAIHASRIPMRMDYVDLRIPIISRGADPSPGEWHEKADWTKIDLSKNYTYLSQFADETRTELFESLNKAYPAIYRHAEKLFKKKKVDASQWPPPSAPQSAPCYSFINHPPSGVNEIKRNKGERE